MAGAIDHEMTSIDRILNTTRKRHEKLTGNNDMGLFSLRNENDNTFVLLNPTVNAVIYNTVPSFLKVLFVVERYSGRNFTGLSAMMRPAGPETGRN